ncbi:hypothetical protein CL617_00625 [archaeon]|nr:hypothetical protein [archaeon]
MKPIKLRIRKKTRVPTKNQIIHQFRSDWKLVGIIDYPDSVRMFKNIGNGPILTDSQFAKFIRSSWGDGIYSIIAWRKGYWGFWGFYYVEIANHGFRRLKKQITYEQKEIVNLKIQIRKNEKKLLETKSISERNELLKDIEDLKQDIDMEKQIKDLDKPVLSGPSPYLKQTQPIYRFHSYEDVIQETKKEVVVDEFW